MGFQPRLASPLRAVDAKPFEKVAVIGLGYIGLPTAAVMAARGIQTVGIDINPDIISAVNQGKGHITEPMLDQTIRASVEAGMLSANETVPAADAFIITVPTPLTKDKKADLAYVMAAADTIGPVLKTGDLIILESTVPVGTTEKLSRRLAATRRDLSFPDKAEHELDTDINIAYCPERVLPGNIIEELVANDRSIGGLTPQCTERAMALYRLFVQGELLGVDARTAELCKLAENAFRDVNIAYANELATVCDTLDINVGDVIALANRHPRVNILQSGPGVGGHCLAVDPWFIAESAAEDAQLIKTARCVNDMRPEHIFQKIESAVMTMREKGVQHPVITLLGLAYKANIDDLRESPALNIAVKVATAQWGSVIAVEPNINRLPEGLQAGGVQLGKFDTAIAQADIIVLLVDHQEFKQLSVGDVSEKIVINSCRNMSRFASGHKGGS
jgi:UDP-N-acetyl-D-mannosaminuronic acid dehydrogenase